MDPITRKNAEEKADKITNMIGYPDYIMNNTALEEKYSDLVVEEDKYFQNSIRFNQVQLHDFILSLFHFSSLLASLFLHIELIVSYLVILAPSTLILASGSLTLVLILGPCSLFILINKCKIYRF